MYPGGTEEWFDKEKSEGKSSSKEVLFDDAGEDEEEVEKEEEGEEKEEGEESEEEAEEKEEEKEEKEEEGEEKEEEDDVIYYFSKSKHTKWLSTFNKAKSFEYKGMKRLQ